MMDLQVLVVYIWAWVLDGDNFLVQKKKLDKPSQSVIT